LFRKLSCQCEPFFIPAQIDRNLASAEGKAGIQPVILKFCDGAWFAEPVFGKSGMISTLTRAHGYIIIDHNKEGLNKGEIVHVYRI
jgi:molybdopterin molybdotransferase